MPRLKEKFTVTLSVNGDVRSYVIEATKGNIAESRAIKDALHFYPEADIKIISVVKHK